MTPRVTRTVRLFLLSVCALTLVCPRDAAALPGDLDTAFSGDGKVTTVFDNGPEQEPNALTIQPDGKIVVVGVAGDDFAIARYTSGGSLDSTFRGGGKFATEIGGTNDVAGAVALQPDGKIVVAGTTNVGGDTDFALARYNADGSPDTSFGNTSSVLTAGERVTDFSNQNDFGRSVFILSDGKILVVGTATESSQRNVALARYTSSGTLDNTFSGDGKVTNDFGSGVGGTASADTAQDAVQLADGTIVVAAQSDADILLIKYSTDGAVLASKRFTTTDAGRTKLALQSNGHIVFIHGGDIQTGGGSLPVQNFHFLSVNRLNPDLSNDGGAVFSLANQRASVFEEDVAVQPDGRIVVSAAISGLGGLDAALIRFNSVLTLDTTFSGDGRVTTDFDSSRDTANALAIQKTDGRIVVAGSTGPRDDLDTRAFAIIRYHAFQCSGRNVTRIGTNTGEVINGRTTGVVVNGTIQIAHLVDVINGLGGPDTINGLGNNDTLCGGSGNDALNGGDGDDTLLGEQNRDALDGGPNTDVCIGGGQAGDSFSSCETTNTGAGGFSGAWSSTTLHCNGSPKNPRCKVRATLHIVNPGTQTTAVPALVSFFLSEDGELDEHDVFLRNRQLDVLAAGETQDIGIHLKLPHGVNGSGHSLIAVLDTLNVVPELNEDNNVVVSLPLD